MLNLDEAPYWVNRNKVNGDGRDLDAKKMIDYSLQVIY